MLRLHSRPATLRRIGASGHPDLFSPIRVTPSHSYRIRDQHSVSNTAIRGWEYVVTTQSILGSWTQTLLFTTVPTMGTFKLTYNSLDTTDIDPTTATAADIQAALRLLTGLAYVTVTGDFTAGFVILFLGVQTLLTLTATGDMTFDSTMSFTYANTPWAGVPPIKRGDKILDPVLGSLAVKSIQEMVDIGGDIMGFKLECE